jgi:hypothetical protein
MLFKDIIFVYNENHTKPIHIVLKNVKIAVTYDYR